MEHSKFVLSYVAGGSWLSVGNQWKWISIVFWEVLQVTMVINLEVPTSVRENEHVIVIKKIFQTEIPIEKRYFKLKFPLLMICHSLRV